MLRLLVCVCVAVAGALRLPPPVRRSRSRSGVRMVDSWDAEEPIDEIRDADEPIAPPPAGYVYDVAGRLIKEETPSSPLVQKIVGVLGILLSLYAAGFLINFSFSPASPLLADNQAPNPFTDGATAKYFGVIRSVTQPE